MTEAKEHKVKKTLLIILTALAWAVLSTTMANAARQEKTPVTFKLVSGLPATMNVGESYSVIVQVESLQEFISAHALPDDQFPGKGVVSNGASHSGAGTSAVLNIVFSAKSSTSKLPDGTDQVAVVAGVRYPNGQTVSQRFEFSVTVP
jgi:sRNA-binding regulator protein Hfq